MTKDHRLANFRVSPHLYSLMKETAAQERMSLSEWLRRQAIRRAAEVAAQNEEAATTTGV